MISYISEENQDFKKAIIDAFTMKDNHDDSIDI